jgi:hypothetical protein
MILMCIQTEEELNVPPGRLVSFRTIVEFTYIVPYPGFSYFLTSSFNLPTVFCLLIAELNQGNILT